ncbi:stearoyl-CoA desaturase, partial [Acrasis kona]
MDKHVNDVYSMIPKELLGHLPSELFEKSSIKAAMRLLQTLIFMAAGIAFLFLLPWYLLPISWIWLGIVCLGLYAVADSCSRDSFFNEKNIPSWLNKIVGAACMMPLLIPFENFRLHNEFEQTAKPQQEQSDEDEADPLWFIASFKEWVSSNIYVEGKRSVVLNMVCVYVFAAIIFSLTIYFSGVAGLFKYYLGPLLTYHFMMSTVLKADEKNLKNKKASITNFPRLIEVLTNYVNHNNSYQIRFKWKKNNNQISDLLQYIPSYNLGEAKRLLREKFGNNLEKINAATFSWRSLLEHYDNIDWIMCVYLLGSVALSFYAIFACEYNWRTYLLCFLGYYIGGISITMGYHRLFAHRSYKAHWSIRSLLLIVGTSTFQGSVLQWSSDHRIHHQHTDTDKDPYNITKGFNYAHWGWLFVKDAARNELHDVDDLQQDPLVMFQHNHYKPLAVFLGYILPTLIAGYFWGDWKGGFLLGGVLSKTLLQHCTFFINSLAHSWGDANWSDKRTARDSHLVSYVTFGEGIHNFHHEFPHDYRNGVHYHHYDPGKWLIWLANQFGLTWDLKRVEEDNYTKGHLQMLQKKLDEEQEKLNVQKNRMNWGPSVESLPTISRRNVDKTMMIIDGVAHDCSTFASIHPGGETILKPFLGRDATRAFNGSVYNHSNNARNVLATL